MTWSSPSTLTSYIARQSVRVRRLDRVGAERAAGVVDQHVQRVADGARRAPATDSGRVTSQATARAADLLGERLDPVAAAGGADHPEALARRGRGRWRPRSRCWLR